MTSMSNNYMVLSKGYVEVLTTTGVSVKTYAEIKGCFASDFTNVILYCKAPKGFAIGNMYWDEDVVNEEPNSVYRGGNMLFLCGLLSRDWNFQWELSRMLERHLRIQLIPLMRLEGYALVSERFGIISAGSYDGSLVNLYRKAYEVKLDPVVSWDRISVFALTNDDVDTVITMIDSGEEDCDRITYSTPLITHNMRA